jgi:hypothetical protein
VHIRIIGKMLDAFGGQSRGRGHILFHRCLIARAAQLIKSLEITAWKRQAKASKESPSFFEKKAGKKLL